MFFHDMRKVYFQHLAYKRAPQSRTPTSTYAD